MRLDLVSAWNDSGGGYLTRLLDGAPATQVWPYELLLGNNTIVDGFGDWFKKCYRWPGFGDEEISLANAVIFFDETTDSEIKSVLVERQLSKHHEFSINFDIDSWRAEFLQILSCKSTIRRSDLLPAYINPVRRAVWPNFDDANGVVGHCPVIIIDALKIWRDIPNLKFVHVVRHPVNCFNDFLKRHRDIDPARYALKWKAVNDYALSLAKLYPQRVKLISLPELLREKNLVMASICGWLQIGFGEINTIPTWLSHPLDIEKMGPFGGIPEVTLERELRLINQHSKQYDQLLKLCEGSLMGLGDFGINLHSQ